jgi:hypothetical protein
MLKSFSSLCTPAKVYFAIAVIASVIALFKNVAVMAVVVKLLFAFIWTYVLAWLCTKGYKSISWFLVLLPYIIIAIAYVGIYKLSSYQQRLLSSTQLQPALIREGLGYHKKK